MSMTVSWFTLDNCIWSRLLTIQSHESLAIGVKTLYWGIHRIESVMVATLAIFCLMVDC